jgi:hypothetical protein
VKTTPKGRGRVEAAGHRLASAGNAPRLREHLAGPQEGLARHARPVSALPAHELRLDQSRLQSALGASTGGYLALRAAAHHDHVILSQDGPTP